MARLVKILSSIMGRLKMDRMVKITRQRPILTRGEKRRCFVLFLSVELFLN